MKEIIEMAQALLEMDINTYMKCKYTLQTVSKYNPKLNNFINVLFSLTDKGRPLLIGMK